MSRPRTIPVKFSAKEARTVVLALADASKAGSGGVLVDAIVAKIDDQRQRHPQSMTVRFTAEEARRLDDELATASGRARSRPGHFGGRLAEGLADVRSRVTTARVASIGVGPKQRAKQESESAVRPTLFDDDVVGETA